jgi:hypothetical protein
LARHRESVQYFKHVLSEHRDEITVIVGHHAPSHLSVHDNYKHDNLMNRAYYSDLSEIILDNSQIKAWFMGHMHMPHRYWIGDTMICCNPRGYAGHDPDAESFHLQHIDLNNMSKKFDGVKWGRD